MVGSARTGWAVVGSPLSTGTALAERRQGSEVPSNEVRDGDGGASPRGPRGGQAEWGRWLLSIQTGERGAQPGTKGNAG